MASTHVRSVAVAQEWTFASIQSTTGLPDSPSLFTVLEAERASITPVGEQVVAERSEGRASAYIVPSEPETMYTSGVAQRRRTADITIQCPLRTDGTNDSWNATPLHYILASGMGVVTATDVSSTPTAAGTVNTFDVTGGTNLAIGEGLKVDRDGRAEYTFITDITAGVDDTITHSPAVSTGISNTDTVWHGHTYYPVLGTPSGASVVLQLDIDDKARGGARIYAYGCRMVSWKCAFTDSRRAVIEVTLRAAVIQDEHGSAATSDPSRAQGSVAHLLGSYVVYSGSLAGVSAPATTSRSTVDVDEVEVSWTNTLAPRGHSDDLAAMAEMEVVDTVCEASVLLSDPVSALDDDLLSQVRRSILVGLGPTGGGNGAVFYVPAGVQVEDGSRRDVGGDLVRQRVIYRQGLWNYDDGTTGAANTAARLFVPRGV